MIVFLRDENNNTICETEVYITNRDTKPQIDIISSVNIIFYSKKLLGLDKKSQRRFIEDIDELSELRAWYFDHFRKSIKLKAIDDIDKQKRMVEQEIKEIYTNVSVKYGLELKND